eukprot:CAMPEP_0174737844 /NCGR_PEP_ID=MMETSP1094-20130205/68948_1 /TAXON_ID=156173 /ORGANISM="Chrysochromulina brevifilum, Strain UTEX LB 985" /LENGTH=76 /DNA_ID=CAMNT_0015941133 /DNA_START=66 /DNA_END=293 /DNA_ORIENTATION=-
MAHLRPRPAETWSIRTTACGGRILVATIRELLALVDWAGRVQPDAREASMAVRGDHAPWLQVGLAREIDESSEVAH